ncbi:MAG: hypothetical protein HYU35_02245 [Parcubacteria group bacterium]|nr:hypothetical protein [Parcubacteria group bacterium]
MRKIITAVIVLVIIIVGVMFLRGEPAVAPSGEAVAPDSSEIAGDSGTMAAATITYTNNGYAPSALRVAKGATVTFKNESGRQMWPASAIHPTHTVYDGTSLSEHCPNINNAAFDACEGIASGASWPFTFAKAGTWRYHNHLQTSHAGTIEVAE